MDGRRLSSLLLAVIILLVWSPFAPAEGIKDRKTYEQRSEKELQSMDKRIDELKLRAAKAKTDAGKEYDAMVADLKEKRDYAGKKWQDVKKAGSEKWEQARTELDSALKDLKDSYNRAASRMQKKG